MSLELESQYIALFNDYETDSESYLKATQALIDFHLPLIEDGIVYWMKTYERILNAETIGILKQIIEEHYLVRTEKMPCKDRKLVRAAMEGCTHFLYKRLYYFNKEDIVLSLRAVMSSEEKVGMMIYREIVDLIAKDRGFPDTGEMLQNLCTKI